VTFLRGSFFVFPLRRFGEQDETFLRPTDSKFVDPTSLSMSHPKTKPGTVFRSGLLLVFRHLGGKARCLNYP
jgi:hypothetical protein